MVGTAPRLITAHVHLGGQDLIAGPRYADKGILKRVQIRNSIPSRWLQTGIHHGRGIRVVKALTTVPFDLTRSGKCGNADMTQQTA